jgi:hypothetical protein
VVHDEAINLEPSFRRARGDPSNLLKTGFTRGRAVTSGEARSASGRFSTFDNSGRCRKVSYVAAISGDIDLK